jgi:preprotein translocase subunit YajC
MFDISQIFVGQAWAQSPAAPGGSASSTLMNFLPLLLIFLVFYVLIIRPQQKKMEAQEKMIKALQRGDRVVTSGGIHGKISKFDGDDIIILEIADGVQIKIGRSHVGSLAAKTQPITANDDDTGKQA